MQIHKFVYALDCGYNQLSWKLKNNPKITTEELAQLCGNGVRTIKRHISKLAHIRYVGSGYSGHWEIIDRS